MTPVRQQVRYFVSVAGEQQQAFATVREAEDEAPNIAIRFVMAGRGTDEIGIVRDSDGQWEGLGTCNSMMTLDVVNSWLQSDLLEHRGRDRKDAVFYANEFHQAVVKLRDGRTLASYSDPVAAALIRNTYSKAVADLLALAEQHGVPVRPVRPAPSPQARNQGHRARKATRTASR